MKPWRKTKRPTNSTDEALTDILAKTLSLKVGKSQAHHLGEPATPSQITLFNTRQMGSYVTVTPTELSSLLLDCVWMYLTMANPEEAPESFQTALGNSYFTQAANSLYNFITYDFKDSFKKESASDKDFFNYITLPLVESSIVTSEVRHYHHNPNKGVYSTRFSWGRQSGTEYNSSFFESDHTIIVSPAVKAKTSTLVVGEGYGSALPLFTDYFKRTFNELYSSLINFELTLGAMNKILLMGHTHRKGIRGASKTPLEILEEALGTTVPPLREASKDYSEHIKDLSELIKNLSNNSSFTFKCLTEAGPIVALNKPHLVHREVVLVLGNIVVHPSEQVRCVPSKNPRKASNTETDLDNTHTPTGSENPSNYLTNLFIVELL